MKWWVRIKKRHRYVIVLNLRSWLGLPPGALEFLNDL